MSNVERKTKIKSNLELDDQQLEKFTDFLVWLKEDIERKNDTRN